MTETINNGGPVDVLAVLDLALMHAGADLSVERDVEDDLSDARAAVAELIDADREYDAAMSCEADTDGMLRRESARARRRAALARVGAS